MKLFAVALVIWAQITGNLWFSLFALVLVFVLVKWSAPQLLKKILRWKLWIGMIGITVLTGAFLGKTADLDVFGLSFSSEGILAGLTMVVRALSLVLSLSLLASAISAEKATRFFAYLGLRQLVPAMSLAANALPAVIDRWSKMEKKPKRLLDGIVGTVVAVARESDNWENAESKTLPKDLRITVVTGEVGIGKTELLYAVKKNLQAQNKSVDGILQPRVFKDGKRIGYDIDLAATGERKLLARSRVKRPGFDFSPRGFLFARDAISKVRQESVHFVDELGKIESRGGGHMPTALRSMRRVGGKWIVTGRKDRLESVLAHLPSGHFHVIDLDETEALVARDQALGFLDVCDA